MPGLLKFRQLFFKLCPCLPLLLFRHFFSGEGADMDGAFLVFNDERGANGKADGLQPAPFHLYLWDRGGHGGA